LIINGSIHEFQGGRTASEIVEYLIKRTGPPYVKVDSDQQVQTHRE